MDNQAFKQAIEEFKKISGLIVLNHEQVKTYQLNTLGSERKIMGVLIPSESVQISEIVKIANKFQVALYTISTGRNWGYGSRLPVLDSCFILDLSRLKKILNFEPDLGTVTVEPGVTQQDLYNYFKSKNVDFMVPTTGAGPSCSVLANALEKGYGLTPHEDHFGALLNLNAVLPDGSLYRSSLHDFGGYRVDAIFKWKIGPYLDGLFAQSNLGIVTQATFALVRRPETSMQFVAFIKDESFEPAVHVLRDLKQALGAGLLGGVNLMNKRRLLSMVAEPELWRGQGIIPEAKIRLWAKQKRIPDWAMVGGIYGHPQLRDSLIDIIRKELSPYAYKTFFLDTKLVALADSVTKLLGLNQFKNAITGLTQSLEILFGTPNQVALPLAYLKNKNRPDLSRLVSPDEDRCGLIWFSPLLPMDAPLVRDFCQEVTRICVANGFEPLITLTGISERCFDSTAPLLFDPLEPADRERARTCYDRLIDLSVKFGVFPYRLDIESLKKFYIQNENYCPSLELYRKIKMILDPKNILSPGRYSK